MAFTHRSASRLVSSLIAGLMMLCASVSPVFADSIQEAEQLLRLKQPQQALEKIDIYLAQRPRDPQGRFFKGLILTELGKIPEATLVFQKLTEDYPELPEPYNNLAVLYAQQKQYDKAKTALEMAIRTHPSYAVAHENLGDIYARMATQAYDRALQLDSSNKAAQSKLNLIREMVGNGSRGNQKPRAIAPIAAAPSTATATPAPAAPPAPSTPAAPAAPAKQPEAAKPAEVPKPPAPTAAAPAPVPAPAAAVPAPAPKADVPAATVPPVAELTRTVQDWAAAWSRKDVKSYLGYYAADFKVPDGKPRGAWETERRSRIAKPGAIEVRVENVKVKSVATDRADATFRQHYKAVGLKTSTTKTLTLVRRDGRWLIQQERVGG
ncbi:tetratricopeptide repeat protein [Methyloversatilis discipulorum]|uniref:nuclear transport factor 2 family protein n=1 Tax=Methyloversatilis discipulorum TaxID=1119528 RepID=UPI0003657ED5|nr:tetratricopeptide repeat protein [Methyloversatilis discipulorum]